MGKVQSDIQKKVTTRGSLAAPAWNPDQEKSPLTPDGQPVREKWRHRQWTGTIYSELHNHGRKSNGSQDGNRSSMRRVRGVGMQRCYGYRWVAEITIHRKRYRCRSYSYNRVREWLDGMLALVND